MIQTTNFVNPLNMQEKQTSSTITSPGSSQPCTILRIKRKRNEEPLDALVVETMRRKKSRGVGVFQYAETVEDGAWDNVERQRHIQENISRLAQDTAIKSDATAGNDNVPPSSSQRSSDKVRPRYTIIDPGETEMQHKRPRTVPPQVLPAESTDFKLYDAVPASHNPVIQQSTSAELDKFLPLLNDYLKIHDITPSEKASEKQLRTSGKDAVDDSSDDYVWDVFYHRPATLSEWNAAANVGTVTGLPSDLKGYDSLSDSDDEFLDEADEDSNAEEYYKNDYPEEEDGSDGFHEDSDYDRIVYYHNSDDDFN